MQSSQSNASWHSLDIQNIQAQFQTSLSDGLSTAQVEENQTRHGKNKLKQAHKKSLIMLFLSQFNQALVYILLLAVAVTLALSEYVDASVIFGVVLVNAIIGFVQESKASAAIDALSKW